MDGIEQKSLSNFKTYFFIALVVIAGLGLIGGGIFVYNKALSSKNTAGATPTPAVSLATPSLSESEEVTPTPSLNKADLKIKVLNGTGTPGAAGKAAKLLEDSGYEGIKTGNASKFDYEETVIEIKESKKDFLSLLSESLSKNYQISEDSKTLDEKDSFDVIITLGKK